jgi:hypothetical protein
LVHNIRRCMYEIDLVSFVMEGLLFRPTSPRITSNFGENDPTTSNLPLYNQMSNVNNQSQQPDDEVNLRRILRQRHREGTRRTICAPCRTRKVKCDKTQPCGNCRKRGYPELCSYTSQTRNQSGDGIGTTPRPSASPIVERTSGEHDEGHVTPSRNHGSPRSHISACPSFASPSGSLSDVSPTISAIERERRRQQEHFLGANSMPSFLQHENSNVGLSSEHNTHRNSVQEAILPLMGLEGSRSTYPFLPTLQSSTERLEELHQALPVDREIIRYNDLIFYSHGFICPEADNRLACFNVIDKKYTHSQ